MRIDENVMLTDDNHGIEYLLKSVTDCYHEAIREGIKANSIVINKNMVKVPDRFGEWPTMICGLNCYVTADELPDGYSFAVVEDKNKPQTHADRIRAMSDEELARHLHCIGWDCNLCAEHERLDNEPLLRGEKCDENCFEHCLEWLKQPAEVDNG